MSGQKSRKPGRNVKTKSRHKRQSTDITHNLAIVKDKQRIGIQSFLVGPELVGRGRTPNNDDIIHDAHDLAYFCQGLVRTDFGYFGNIDIVVGELVLSANDGIRCGST